MNSFLEKKVKLVKKIGFSSVLYTLLAVFSVGSAFSQGNKFTFTKDGFSKFVVTECGGKDNGQKDLYQKTLDWVSVTYKNPNETIVSKVDNDNVVIEGLSDNLLCLNYLGEKNFNNAKYTIKISFKNGKYKLEVIDIKSYSTPSEYVKGGWYDVKLDTTEDYYNQKGELRELYQFYPEVLTSFLNGMNDNLKTFIETAPKKAKKEDW